MRHPPPADPPRDACLIVGAGPAGCLLARQLADWGRAVILLHRPSRGRVIPEETLVAAAGRQLEVIGLLELVQRRGWLASERHGIRWGEEDLRWREGGAAAAGFQVPRAAFDEELLRRAEAAGACLVPVRQVSVTRDGQVAWRGREGQAGAAAPRVVVLATGKSPGIPGASLRAIETLPATAALVARIEDAAGLEQATVIESVPEGWWWWLPLVEGGVLVTLFADGGELRANGAGSVWAAARAHARGPARAAPTIHERSLPATPRLRRPPPGVLLCGDAASSVDPLSSQGLEKAMASALETAHAVNTLLERPSEAGQLADHLARWEAGLFRAHAARTLDLYGRETRWPEAPFWRARRPRPADAATGTPPALPAAVQPAPDLRAVCSYSRGNRVLETVTGYAAGDQQDVLTDLAGVPVAALLAAVGPGRPLTAILAHAARDPRLTLTSPRVVETALTTLLQRGLLVPGEPPGA